MYPEIDLEEFEYDLKNRKGHVKIVREIVYDAGDSEEEFM